MGSPMKWQMWNNMVKIQYEGAIYYVISRGNRVKIIHSRSDSVRIQRAHPGTRTLTTSLKITKIYFPSINK